MQNVIGFYGYLVCCIDFEKRGGTAARERALPLSQCHLQSTTISLYGPALCFYKNHNTTQTITVFLLPLMMVIFGEF